MKNDKTIYIADDDEDDRMLLREAIRDVIEDAVIREVGNGEELVDLIRREGPATEAVILMDMNMPRMNGLEALAIIKSDPDLLHIPVIMVSTASNVELVSRAYLNGINAFIAKPSLLNEYLELARAVNMCFFQGYPAFDESAAIKNLSAKSILVIEDNADQSKLINLALKQSVPNAEIITVTDENSSMEFLSSHWHQRNVSPQLILLDLYLPERKNGLALLEVIKEFLVSENLTTIPIIVLSQSDDRDDVRDCYRRQANAYMTKSSDLKVWFSFFSYLCHFWMDTITTRDNSRRF